MVSSFTPWFGKTVTLRLLTGQSCVLLRGVILAESESEVRFRVGKCWDIVVYKSMILAVEQYAGHGK